MIHLAIVSSNMVLTSLIYTLKQCSLVYFGVHENGCARAYKQTSERRARAREHIIAIDNRHCLIIKLMFVSVCLSVSLCVLLEMRVYM